MTEEYWTERYKTGKTGWDIGYVSTPLKAYIDQLEDKSLKILVPGAGNGYEAVYLWEQGFTNTHVVDISEEPLKRLQQQLPQQAHSQLYHANFFDLSAEALGGKFDLILEQTFFCALNPSWRENYARQMKSLLKEGGKLAGVLFNIPLYDEHPPYGGHAEQYRKLFAPHFEFKHFEECHNSIPPRSGNELFICLEKTRAN